MYKQKVNLLSPLGCAHIRISMILRHFNSQETHTSQINSLLYLNPV